MPTATDRGWVRSSQDQHLTVGYLQLSQKFYLYIRIVLDVYFGTTLKYVSRLVPTQMLPLFPIYLICDCSLHFVIEILMLICFLIFVLCIVSLVSARGKFKRQISFTYYVSSRSRSGMNERCLFFVNRQKESEKKRLAYIHS